MDNQSLKTLSNLISSHIEQYPQNSRRPVNKIVYQNNFFEFIRNENTGRYTVKTRGDLVYSAMPYDTSRFFIETAARIAMAKADDVREYILLHEENIKRYIEIALFQKTGRRDSIPAKTIQTEYEKIFAHPLFEIQVMGRLLQHDTTGPLSANLPGKFLYDENLYTGNMGYISEYIKFIGQLTNDLQIVTDGVQVALPDSSDDSFQRDDFVSNQSITDAVKYLPSETVRGIVSDTSVNDTTKNPDTMVLLQSVVGEQLANLRENYNPHSINPKLIDPFFANVLKTENKNKINVVSDIHVGLPGQKGVSLPFENKNFNIIAGDASDGLAQDADIKGIYVIGNHDLSDVLHDESEYTLSKYDEYRTYEWFKHLSAGDPNDAWPLLPPGDNDIYTDIANSLKKRFPNLEILNNQSTMHKGVRYIGLTIPVRFHNQAREQEWILQNLRTLLGNDYNTRTIIVSHAPLFNELSMLKKESHSYSEKYKLQNEDLRSLLAKYNVIGVVHGHHHIPAVRGWYKFTEELGRPMFVVDSVYAKNNTGQELTKLIRQQWQRKVQDNNQNGQIETIKKPDKNRRYDVEEDVENIVGLYLESGKYRVEKNIQGKRIRKRFVSKEQAVVFLNKLNGHI